MLSEGMEYLMHQSPLDRPLIVVHGLYGRSCAPTLRRILTMHSPARWMSPSDMLDTCRFILCQQDVLDARGERASVYEFLAFTPDVKASLARFDDIEDICREAGRLVERQCV